MGKFSTSSLHLSWAACVCGGVAVPVAVTCAVGWGEGGNWHIIDPLILGY